MSEVVLPASPVSVSLQQLSCSRCLLLMEFLLQPHGVSSVSSSVWPGAAEETEQDTSSSWRSTTVSLGTGCSFISQKINIWICCFLSAWRRSSAASGADRKLLSGWSASPGPVEAPPTTRAGETSWTAPWKVTNLKYIKYIKYIIHLLHFNYLFISPYFILTRFVLMFPCLSLLLWTVTLVSTFLIKFS